MSSTSSQRAAALAFLDSFDKLDGDANIALRAPNCRHTMAPTSLGFSPNMTNEQWAAHLNSTKQVLTSFPVMAKEIFESGNQVTVWATSEAVFREDAKDDEDGVDWTYHGEYMFVFLFDGDGKIERIVEFLDSVKVVQVGALIERAKRNLKTRKEGAS